MSHFLFAAVQPTTDVRKLAVSCQGLAIADSLQAVVSEMLQIHAPGKAGYLIVAKAGDDTSDELVSPFAVAIEVIEQNLRSFTHFARRMFAIDADAEYFLSDGYDVEFEEVCVKSEALEEAMMCILRSEDVWPSLRIRLDG